MKLDNQIGQIGEAVVFENPQQFPQSFTTFVDPATGQTLLAFNATNVNLGKAETNGVDIDAQFRQPFAGGNFRSNFFGTYIFNNKYQVVPGGVYIDDLGHFVNGATTFKFRAKWINTIEMGNWDGTIAVNYMTGYDDDRDNAVLDVAADEFVALERRVDSHTTVDLQGRWRFARNWTLTAGVLNVFSTRPPLSLTTNGGGQMIGYNADYYDPRERTFYAKLAFRW